MARAGRSHPNRPVIAKGQYWRQAAPALPDFEIEAEWPALTLVTPSAQILLPDFEAEAEWPALTLSYGQGVTLPDFEVEAEWPALTITTPIRAGDSITEAGQVEWGGALWGPGTPYRVLLPVEGWRSTPTIDNLNVPRPSRHGAWGARKLAQQRLVTVRLQVDSAADPTQVDDLLSQLDAVTGIAEDETPVPLVVRGYGAPQLAYGQVIDRDVQMDGDYNVGLPGVSILIACEDPRRYNIDQTGAAIPAGGTVQAINAGNTATHPLVRLTGPLTNPAVINAETGRTIAFTLALGVGELLIVDTDRGNATVDGDSVMSTLTGSSAPVADWVLQRGTNTITYTVSSGGDTPLTMLYRDAWL